MRAQGDNGRSLCISSILIISVLVFVAVAVNAITCTLSGIMLRTSPRRENSVTPACEEAKRY